MGTLRPTLIDTLQTLHMVGPLLDLAPPGLVIKRTAEHKRLVSDLCWWLRQQPGVSSRSSAAISFHVCLQQHFIQQRSNTPFVVQVAVAFVDATTELVHDGKGSSLQVRWRRSSIAVLARLLRCTPCQVPLQAA